MTAATLVLLFAWPVSQAAESGDRPPTPLRPLVEALDASTWSARVAAYRQLRAVVLREKRIADVEAFLSDPPAEIRHQAGHLATPYRQALELLVDQYYFRPWIIRADHRDRWQNQQRRRADLEAALRRDQITRAEALLWIKTGKRPKTLPPPKQKKAHLAPGP